VVKTPNFNIGTIQISRWRRLTDENPYRFEERTYTVKTRNFGPRLRLPFGMNCTTVQPS
jgi:hypothetical protein